MPSSQLASIPKVAPVAADHFAQNQQRPGVAEDLERRIDGASATRFRVHGGLILPSPGLESLGFDHYKSTSTSGDDMSRVRVHNFSVSPDGFGTGEGQKPDAQFGHAGSSR